jgi:dihydrofolate reductase
MRKVVAYEPLSLDGVAEQPDGFVTEFDEVMRENLGRVIATQDAVLLGRRTYDDWAEFWPTSGYEPFASFINGVDKFVVTATTSGLAWANTTVVDGGLPAFITELTHRTAARGMLSSARIRPEQVADQKCSQRVARCERLHLLGNVDPVIRSRL